MLRYALTDAEPVRPKRLRFNLLSAEEIRRMSVCQVTETTLYYRGLPATGSLLDPLMGSIDRRHLCVSCMRDARTCPGHAGHIELAYPVYHFGYVDTILKVLRTVCFHCTRMCATDADLENVRAQRGRQRLASLHAAVRGRRACPHCGIARPSFTRTAFGIQIEWPEDFAWESEEERAYCTAPFTAREALSMLSHLTDDDVELLGFSAQTSHPRNMIAQSLVVPPPSARPAIYSSEGSRSRGQNDLTVRLIEVLRRSHEVAAAIPAPHTWRSLGTPSDDFLERLSRLQYEVFLMVNNGARVQKPPGMGRAGANTNAKTLLDRIKGKEGRVRGNLMGKRVDFSARCVITPDAYFDCDRVGVPERIAVELTFPEVVNAINRTTLEARVRRGAQRVDGAQTVLHADGTVTHLASCRDRDAVVVRVGDVVERYLANDDVVVFNRQPSLHLHGMVAHRVRIMPGHTFRIALPVAAPYNADFDGDEMNLHVPQSRAAVAECATLMAVAQANGIGAQANRPVMGIVQDSLLSLHLLSQPEVLVRREHACRMLGSTRYASKSLPVPSATLVAADGTAIAVLWTGRQMISCLFPPTLNVEPDRPPSQMSDVDHTACVLGDEVPVVVRDGQLLCGALTKAHLGTSAGGIVDVLHREHGGVACLRFMGDVQRLSHAYLLQRGHHVGIHDVMLSGDGHARVHERLDKAARLCEEIQRETEEASTASSAYHTAECTIMRMLSKMLLQTGGIVNEHMAVTNSIRRMVTAGSKGSFINLSQICAALGQQSLEGTRIGEAGRNARALPCFAYGDCSLASRGMVYNSFALGLSPSELFFHGIGGREGLVDTAVKTSQTGYLQRRLNKSMEDHRVVADGTVRNAMQEVVAFGWGSDRFHPCALERVTLSCLQQPATALAARLVGGVDAAVAWRSEVLRAKTHVLATDLDARVLLPFHPRRVQRRLAVAARERARAPDAAALPMADDEAERRILAMCATVVSSCALALADTFLDRDALRAGDVAWGREVALAERRIALAHCIAGESAGCIAAQSVGEPTTQLTLNSFHTAGVVSQNVVMGVPRLKELLDASKTPKTPCTTVCFRTPYCTSETLARYVAATLPLLRLGDLVARVAIVDRGGSDDPDAWLQRLEALLHDPEEFHSRYVVRLELSQELMRTRHLTPPIVRRLLQERLQGRALVHSSETNEVDWVVRVHFQRVREMMTHGHLADDQEAILCHRATNVLLDTVVVSGHPSVTAADAVAGTRLDAEGVAHAEQRVHVSGVFLVDCAASPCVDWRRCTSNHVWEVYHTLGIEACAHVLYDQLQMVVGAYVDPRHISLIVDTMCRGGTLMPLNRHGINRTDYSPLMRCSFEETIDVLCDAAIYAETENARGVTTSIMTGQLSHFGTGEVEVQLPCATITPPESKRAQVRVMRSTCRSHARPPPEDVLEYVTDDVRTSAPPRLAMHTARVRFRTQSPDADR